MAVEVHVTPTPYAALGLVMLRVDLSGGTIDEVTVERQAVVTGDTLPPIVPAGYLGATATVRLINGSGVWADTTVPLDTPVQYLAAVPGEDPVASGDPVTLDSGGVWRLGNPFRPYQDVLLTLAAPTPHCSATGAAVIMGLTADQHNGQGELQRLAGRAGPLVGTDPLETPTFDLRLWTRLEADREAVLDLHRTGDILLLRAPSTYQLAPRYVFVSGVGVERVSADHRKTWRAIVAQLREVDQPVGGAYGWLGVRWVDLCTVYPTWADLLAAGASWATIATGGATGAFPAAMRTWAEVDATWATWAGLTAEGKTWAELVAGD